MASGSKSKFAIVGSGLGGALMACVLGRAGYEVDIYEKRSDPRRPDPESPQEAGRSINLALSFRGLSALRGLGLADEILKEGLPMKGRMMHSREGKLVFQPYGTKPEQANYSISRSGLNLALIKAAASYPGVRYHFDSHCVDVDFSGRSAELENPRTKERSRVSYEVLIGADGAYSAVRRRMMRLERFNFDQTYLEHGYKELTLPPKKDGGFALDPSALHIWPRKDYMLIALPNPDASFTCTLFLPFEGPESFASLKTAEEIRRFIVDAFPDAAELMPRFVSEFENNPTGSLVTVRCCPWNALGQVVLLGDACHAVVPFYGQGMNASFEDCLVLGECLSRYGSDCAKAFVEYEGLRRENTDALAQLSMDNFIEMREKVASWTFLAHKGLEHVLARLLPGMYLPLYHMVTYTRIPYAQAVRRARRQNILLAGVAIAGALFALGCLL